MYADVIREREELSEQIRALKMLKELARIYGYDISKPAKNILLEATQALYFAYLAAVKEQNGAAIEPWPHFHFLRHLCGKGSERRNLHREPDTGDH